MKHFGIAYTIIGGIEFVQGMAQLFNPITPVALSITCLILAVVFSVIGFWMLKSDSD